MDYTVIAITLIFSLLLVSSTSYGCQPLSCSQNQPIVKPPFWIFGRHSESCGYPSFNVSCDTSRGTIIDLPYSGEFIVESIDYAAQDIVLNDPNNCLAAKLFSLDLSASPFSHSAYQSYTFYRCSKDVAPEHKDYVISCLSGSDYTVVAANSAYLIKGVSTVCKAIREVNFPTYASNGTIPLGNDMILTWDAPYCRNCDGTCKFKNSFSRESVCLDAPDKGSNKLVLAATVIGITVAVALGVCGVPCYLSLQMTREAMRALTVDNATGGAASTTVNIVVATTTCGIDTQTLSSYPKVVLGESCRLPSPGDDDTCSICISVYKPKDVVKSIPECNHCFHVDCIDEWLRLNASCPICRISPLHQETVP